MECQSCVYISAVFDLTEHPSRLLSVLNAMEHFKLAIGVLGVTGCGSSSLINALLGLTDGAEGSAPTGITETTKEPVAYSHPTLPNVVLWDLPGVGAIGGLSSLSSAEVPAVPNPCDVYILLCPLRLTHDCLNLLQSLQALGKECYLVLSKMDQVDEEDLKEVKGWSEKAVEQLGLHRAVFLVSALQPEGMDLPKLKDTLCSALPHHRRVALASYVPKLLEQNVQKRPDLCKTM
uniref:IRG-type G domain-containing protein n=1 Tax=Denticeps clupeoides TaxID=299321 RepID=A0AAY4AX78_9TELE